MYTYLRATQSYGNECNILTFPVNMEPSIAIALTFLELWTRQNPQWLSQDVLVLFYEENIYENEESGFLDYGESMREFLNRYYIGHSQFTKENLGELLLDEEKEIHGRCGYIRQGFPFIFKDYNFNKFSLHINGLNGMLSDVDYLHESAAAVQGQGWAMDMSTPAYFRNNYFLKWFGNVLAPPVEGRK